MSKPFKLLRGRTILLDVPKKKESAIQLSAKDEDEIAISMSTIEHVWVALPVIPIVDNVSEISINIVMILFFIGWFSPLYF